MTELEKKLKDYRKSILITYDAAQNSIEEYQCAAQKELRFKQAILDLFTELKAHNSTLKQAYDHIKNMCKELEADANKFPTVSEFSNLQDDYESAKKKIAELEKKYEAYKISNYDPSESIRLNGEIMHQKNRINVRQKIWDVVGECGTGITDREKIVQIESILLDSEELPD